MANQITDAQISALRAEAYQAGDSATVSDCSIALDADASAASVAAARERLADVIADAESAARG